MRWVLAAVLCLALAGCGPSRRDLFLDAHDTCMNYGFRTGTPEYSQCMMQKDHQQASMEMQRRQNVQQALQNMRIQEPVRAAPRTCTSRPGAFGTVVTDCE